MASKIREQTKEEIDDLYKYIKENYNLDKVVI